MLNRNHGPLKAYGFLVGVELEDGILTPEFVAAKLQDSLSFVEGAGAAQIEILGEIQTLDDDDPGYVFEKEALELAKAAETQKES